MTIEDVKITIRNHILNSISQYDLCALCNHFKIPTTNHRNYIKKLLIDSIFVTTDVDLLHRILLMINKSETAVNNYQIISNQTHEPVQNMTQPGNLFSLNENDRNNSGSQINNGLYCISNYNLAKCPIDLRPEILNGIDPKNIYIPCHTKYPAGYFQAPSMNPTLLNGRFNTPNVQLPYTIKSSTVASSQFYCCQVVLHPLSLLIPKPTPNLSQTNRIMSKMQLQFTVSSHTKHLISAHSSQVNNRRNYKWQVLVRFGLYDPSNPFPNSNNCLNDNVSTLPEHIPPYLMLFVNNATVQLWDILPSNSTAKEGKRHPRPINITDYLKYSSSNTVMTAGVTGYRQFITVNWWQTPGVYQYYYFGIYLERKLSVNELNDRFINRTHHIQMPVSFTLDFIKDKFSKSSKYMKEVDEEDDLVISSVLPISLLCPVGKSRINCPLRSINCQHLQCFDAHLYLMMNERRSVWKCPVCDAQATIDDLFVDEFFWDILQKFSNNEDITEVNVNPNGSYVPIVVKESRDHNKNNMSSNNDDKSNVKKDEKQLKENLSEANIDDNSEKNHHVILLESDDEENNDLKTVKCPQILESSQSISTTNSNHSIQKVIDQTPTRTKSLTIDLTSDSDEEKNSNKLNTIFNQNKIVTEASNITEDSLSLNNFSHNHLHLQALQHNMHYQSIAPKMMNNSFAKYSESSGNLYQIPVNFNEPPSVSSNSFQSLSRNLNNSQNPNKIHSFMFMSQNQNRSNNLYSCYMPPMKPCFPTQNFLNMMHPISSNYRQPSSMSTINFVEESTIMHRPIKSDPHSNNNQDCFKKDPKHTSKLSSSCTTRKISERRKKTLSSGSSAAEASVSCLKYRKLSNRNLNARRSSRLNRNKIIYKEKSISDESHNNSTYEEEEEDDDDDEYEDDDEDDDDDDEEEEEIICRPKRRNVFIDSSSSSSSSKSNWKKLVFDQRSEQGHSNNEDVNHRDWQVDIATCLKSPIVILNKLDPTLLKVYLQQNEEAFHLSSEEMEFQTVDAIPTVVVPISSSIDTNPVLISPDQNSTTSVLNDNQISNCGKED